MPAEPKLRGNSRTLISMIPLREMTTDMIADVLQTVPKYGATDFRSLVENTIGAIHQIPRILKWPHSFEQPPEFFKWSLC